VSGLVGTFILVLVGTWNEYLMAVYLTTQNAQTFPLAVVGLAVSPTTFGPQWWYISVLVLIMITPVIVVAIALERFITRGLLSGAMKG
jgi:multiple sugar transport system permease protein